MIKAIPTFYGGYKFRSRLEARYAKLFNSLRLKWYFEMQGYESADGNIYYLPDFTLLNVRGGLQQNFHEGIVIEAKPSIRRLGVPECEKLALLSQSKPVFVATQDFEFFAPSVTTKGQIFEFRQVQFYQCADGTISLDYPFNHSPLVSFCLHYHQQEIIDDDDYNGILEDARLASLCCKPLDISTGITAARSARFEFGESG